MASQGSGFSVKTVAIIGAGPSGIAAAKYLLAEDYFSKIKVFEQRASVGGIWNYTGNIDAKVYGGCITGDGDDSSFITRRSMMYSDLAFPTGTPLLPDWQTILEYLMEYAKDIEHLIDFQQKVQDVRPESSKWNERWTLTSVDLQTKRETSEVYDAVVVANGRYDKPYIPNIPGMDEWNKAYPTALLHSEFYRNSEPFKGKKVVVVGYSSSGTDIGSQIESVCSPPMLVSQKSAGNVSPGVAMLEGKELVPEIEEFFVEDRAIRFSNGRFEKHVDTVVFCTGYSYSYPFLSSLPAFSDGAGNQKAWQHIFYNNRPTLAFVLLPLRVNAFPFSESQAAVIARIWSNRLVLPAKEHIKAWTAKRLTTRGSGKGFHKFGFPADGEVDQREDT